MKTDLVSITTSLISTDGENRTFQTPEQLIVYIARVSNPANQMNNETADKLIDYLIKKKHWSPFEMVDMTIEIVTSRAIAQQILRHRSFSFQEFSQRYAEVTEFEPVQLRRQADKNRQSSTEIFDPLLGGEAASNDGLSPGVDGIEASQFIKLHIEESERLYKDLIEAGVAKECARMVLPLTTQTRIYMKGSVRSWIHYLGQRCHPDTQQEHREIAVQIRDLYFGVYFPNIRKALDLYKF